MARFGSEDTQRLVGPGLAGPHGVSIWVRSDRTGPHRLRLDGRVGGFVVSDDPATDRTAVVRWPEDMRGAPPLKPATSYTFVVESGDGAVIGEGRFMTAPLGPDDAPETWSLGFGSCHQPFEDDGTERRVSLELLSGLERAFDDHGVQAMLLLGDQMYTDLPERYGLYQRRGFRRQAPEGRKTLLDCTAAEVRALLQARYRTFFHVEPFRRLLARFATALVLDDHEIADNFGTDPEHHTDTWAQVREGAFAAFHDYQGQRNHGPRRPETFDLRFAWGPLAGLILDLRTQRIATPDRIQILSEPQWAALEVFLIEQSQRPVIALGLPVPLLHVPAWLVDAGRRFAPWGSGFHDRWSHPLAIAERDRLVHLLRAHRLRHPEQKLLLLSGDVHVGVVSTLDLGGAPPVLQVVSSALSNLERAVIRHGSASMSGLDPCFDTADGVHVEATLQPGVDGHAENPVTTLNAGLLTFRRSAGEWKVRVRLLGPAESTSSDKEEAEEAPLKVAYDSGEL